MNKKDKWYFKEINELSGEESQSFNDPIIIERKNTSILIILIIIIFVGISAYLKTKESSMLEFASEDSIENEFLEEDINLIEEDMNLFEEDINLIEENITLSNENSDVISDSFMLNSSDSDEFAKQFEEYKKNIEISRIIDAQNECHIVITNNNNVEIKDLELYIIYYDQNDNPIEIEIQYFYSILPNSKATSLLYNSPEDFNRFEFLLKSRQNENTNVFYTSCPEDIIYSVVEDNDYITISCENISDSKIDTVTFLVIYYNENDEIVDISSPFGVDIIKNQKSEIQVYKDFELEFYKYEVWLQEAYRSNK